MSDIANGVIQVLDQLKGSGQLNDYLIDDDERKWTKLVYDIMVNKFDMPFGKGTMQQASDIFNNAVRIWKGKNKLGNMMNMESKQTNKKLIRLTESDLHNIVKESVNKILSEMDWRTYRSAGDKAYAKGDADRAENFYNYSNNLLGQKHHLADRGDDEGTFIKSSHGEVSDEGNWIPYGKMTHTPVTYTKNGDSVYGSPDKWNERGFETVSPKQSAKINNAMKDMKMFDNGEYEYGDWKYYPHDRGWHAKGTVRK